MLTESTKNDKMILKASAEDYSPDNFYFIEHIPYNDNEISRLVAYTANDGILALLIKNILNLFSDDLEVLVKVKKDNDGEEDWNRYYGEITKEKLFDVFEKNSKYILYDGSNQFCIKDCQSGDYFVLDEHGIFLIYSIKDMYEDALTSMKFENRKDTMIFEKKHSHVSFEDSKELLQKMIEDFNLEEV